MKLSDYVVNFLSDEGVRHVFGLTGGAVVHLFDSADRSSRVKPIFDHHEQAAALAAEAYARVTNNLGAAFVTTGPGGTNAITGVCAAWLDSLPTVYISGQSRIEHTSRGKPIKQLGSQELDIISLVTPITKYAVMLEDPKMIKYHLKKAVYIARNGRPGPVWIDIPLNFQWTNIEPDELTDFDPSEINEGHLSNPVEESVKQCLELMAESKRPLILAGYGIRLAHAEGEFRKLIKMLKFPFVSTWYASDILPTYNEFYYGRIGTAGQRGGNLAIQNCDLLLCLGSHLSIPLTGTNYDTFAREARIIMVDVDRVELDFKTVKVDVPIYCDVKIFLQEMLEQAKDLKFADISWWLRKCSKYRAYNRIPPEWRHQKEYVNPYVFVDTLSDELGSDDVIVVDGGGTVVYMTFQALKVKEGQRIVGTGGIGAMGTGLPESIGACFASGGRRTICMVGDGSMQLNIQELQTIFHHNLPIKMFVFNNGGYLAIRHTQNGFLKSNYVGSSLGGGLSQPDYLKVAAAYGIKSVRVNNHHELLEKIRWTLNEAGPALCEIMISPKQELIPRMGFDINPDGTGTARPLEDMAPYLDRKEFLENMIVKPLTKP